MFLQEWYSLRGSNFKCLFVGSAQLGTALLKKNLFATDNIKYLSPEFDVINPSVLDFVTLIRGQCSLIFCALIHRAYSVLSLKRVNTITRN